MTDVTIYHNPRCSTCRTTMQLLKDKQIDPKVVTYLEDPPDATMLTKLLDMLGIHPIELIRKKEPLYKELNLDQVKDDPEALIQAMADHPILIERPIVVSGNQARIGRPPQKVLEII